VAVGEERRQPGLLWAVMASANMPVTRYASAPAAAMGVKRPSTRNTPAAI